MSRRLSCRRTVLQIGAALGILSAVRLSSVLGGRDDKPAYIVDLGTHLSVNGWVVPKRYLHS